MIDFDVEGSRVLLVYEPDTFSGNWLDDKLNRSGSTVLSKVFTVRKQDLTADTNDAYGEDARVFHIGELSDGYFVIRADVLGLKHDLAISTSIKLERKVFVAERNISIFRRIDKLTDDQITVGGSRAGAIPEGEFNRLLQTFPTTTELDYYAGARVSRILSEYLATGTDAEKRLSKHIDRKQRAFRQGISGSAVKAQPARDRGRLPVATEIETAKFVYLRDRLREMLESSQSYSEQEWQVAVADLFLLIYPQYIAVLHDVHVKENYSKPGRPTIRKIDLVLVRADGVLDIIEIKKPFEHALMSKRLYRDNHVPLRELSGTIMQADKYVFYLTKAGVEGERAIAKRHADHLPPGITPRIVNPQAIILAGRDHELSDQQSFDLEFARRTHSNIVDIISYDDLLRRLDNMVSALKTRAQTDHGLVKAADKAF